MYRPEFFSKELFQLAVEYLSGLQGQARERIVREAQEIIEAYHHQQEPVEDKQKEISDALKIQDKLDRKKFKRAIQLAKVLS